MKSSCNHGNDFLASAICSNCMAAEVSTLRAQLAIATDTLAQIAKTHEAGCRATHDAETALSHIEALK